MSEPSRDDLLKRLGLELHQALVSQTTIEPLSNRGYELSIADAYAIQTNMISHRVRAGIKIIGNKIGATSEPVQTAVGIDQPDFGMLLEDGAYNSGDIIPFSQLIQPRAEGEIFFVLKEDLTGPGVTPAMVLEATEYVGPCLEIVDSRIRDWEINIVDTIADNASCGVFVLGEARVDPKDIDLSTCEMRVLRNEEQVTHGVGSASLGNPANAVAWLANAFGELGVSLKAGEPIFSGSLGALIDVRKGDEIILEIDQIGCCSARFI